MMAEFRRWQEITKLTFTGCNNVIPVGIPGPKTLGCEGHHRNSTSLKTTKAQLQPFLTQLLAEFTEI